MLPSGKCLEAKNLDISVNLRLLETKTHTDANEEKRLPEEASHLIRNVL